MDGRYPTRWHTVTPTIGAQPAHAAGDALGGRLDLTGMLRESGNGAVLLAISLIHMSTVTFEVDFVFFNDEFQATADDSPFSPTDEDIRDKCLGFVKMHSSDMITTANHAIGTVQCVFPIQQKRSDGTVYCQMVIRSAVTVTTMYVKFGVSKD